MAKKVNNNQTPGAKKTVIVLLVALIILLINMSESTILGYRPSEYYGSTLISIVSVLCFTSLVILFIKRKTATWKFLIELGASVIATFLFLLGWKLAATGVGEIGNIHSDGMSVTGAFMMFFSGLYIGYAAKRGK